jgi:phosphatidate cytidylyltransferase
MSEPTRATREGFGEAPVHPRPATQLPQRAPRSDLPGRLVTAAILIPAVIYVIFRGGLWYLGTIVVFVLLGQREFYRLIEDKGAHPLVGFGLAAGAALPVVAYVGNEYHANLLMTATLLAVMVAQIAKRQITEALASISGTFFGVFYVGWLLSHAVVLRNFYGVVRNRYPEELVAQLQIVPDTGIFLMLFAVSAVIGCDVGAYFGGKAYGKRKLAPRISPGKTVEGAVAGVLGGIAAGSAAKALFDVAWPDLSALLPWAAVLPFAVLLSVVGIIGDLVESLIKRDAEVKDTGQLLPGTGGVLDRIDSNLLGIPVMYYVLLLYVFLNVQSLRAQL